MRRSVRELENESHTINKISDDIKLKKKIKKRRRRARIMKRLALFLLLVIIGLSVYLFDQSKYSRIQVLKVSGNSIISDEEVMDLLSLKEQDRLLSSYFKRKGDLKRHPLVDDIKINVYLRQGYVNVDVAEKTPLAYTNQETALLYFDNAYALEISETNIHAITGLPLLINFKEEYISENLLKGLKNLDESVLLAISEIHHEPKELDEFAMKMVMNDNYFVYTSIETLPMLGSYATLINGADEGNRCIDMIEYGPSEETTTAIVRKCK